LCRTCLDRCVCNGRWWGLRRRGGDGRGGRLRCRLLRLDALGLRDGWRRHTVCATRGTQQQQHSNGSHY
jgi:hypothetical protein